MVVRKEHQSEFVLHQTAQYVDKDGKEMIMVIFAHVGHYSMKFKVSENGAELLVTLLNKFSSATAFIDPKIKSIEELMDDPQSKILNALFNQPPAPIAYTIKLGKSVASKAIKRPVKSPDGSTVRTIILLTVCSGDTDTADSMESL